MKISGKIRKIPRSVLIAGTGHCVPEKILTNADLEKIVDTTDEWITTRTGIKERHIADENTASSDLAIQAAKQAIEMAGISPLDIDKIILGTITPDMFFPSTACIVQAQIGAKNAMVMDISAACSGFLYGIDLAYSQIALGRNDVILVIGVEILTKITDFTDRNTCVLFGDGAGAVILMPSDNDDEGILATYGKSDGTLGELLYMPAGGSRMPATIETVEKRLHYLKMAGRDVFKYAVKAMSDAALKALEKAGVSGEEVDLLISHQANIRIIESTAKRAKIPMEKVFINIHKYGNTSSASIPIALNEAVRSGRIKKGDLVLLVAFGGGFTWGSALIRWTK